MFSRVENDEIECMRIKTIFKVSVDRKNTTQIRIGSKRRRKKTVAISLNNTQDVQKKKIQYFLRKTHWF